MLIKVMRVPPPLPNPRFEKLEEGAVFAAFIRMRVDRIRFAAMPMRHGHIKPVIAAAANGNAVE